jgi:hypothetical protein
VRSVIISSSGAVYHHASVCIPLQLDDVESKKKILEATEHSVAENDIKTQVSRMTHLRFLLGEFYSIFQFSAIKWTFCN